MIGPHINVDGSALTLTRTQTEHIRMECHCQMVQLKVCAHNEEKKNNQPLSNPFPQIFAYATQHTPM